MGEKVQSKAYLILIWNWHIYTNRCINDTTYVTEYIIYSCSTITNFKNKTLDCSNFNLLTLIGSAFSVEN